MFYSITLSVIWRGINGEQPTTLKVGLAEINWDFARLLVKVGRRNDYWKLQTNKRVSALFRIKDSVSHTITKVGVKRRKFHHICWIFFQTGHNAYFEVNNETIEVSISHSDNECLSVSLPSLCISSLPFPKHQLDASLKVALSAIMNILN